MFIAVISWYLLFTCSVVLVGAQSCEPFKGSPLTSHVCDQFVGPNVFVPFNTSQADLDALVASNVRKVQAIAPYKCAKAAIELFCQTAFLYCNPKSLPLPSFPCKAKCNLTLEECKPYSANVGALASIDCNVHNNQTMQEQWPAERTAYNFSGVILFTQCNHETNNNTVSLDPSSCPFPMEVDANHSSVDPPCRFRCPLPILTPHEYDADRKLSYVLASISVVCLVFLMCSFALAYRKYPFNLFQYLFFTSIVVAVMVIVPAAGGDNFVCHNGVPSTQRNYAPCAIQGALLFYFGLSATCWWFTIILNLYLMVTGRLDTKRRQVKAQRIFKCFGWGFPLVTLIIAFSASEFSYNAPNILCFLPLFGEDVWYQYALFYIPVGITSVSGATLMVIIVLRLVRSWMSLGKHVDADTRTTFAYYKIAIFGLSIMVVWGSIFIGRMTVANDKPATESFTNWVICHIEAYSQNLPYSVCGEVPPVRVNRGSMVLQYVAQSVHGVIFLLVFCRDRALYTSWQLAFIRFYSVAKGWWLKVMQNSRREEDKEEKRRVEMPMRVSPPVSETSLTSVE